jgi:predicted transcriptional regulator
MRMKDLSNNKKNPIIELIKKLVITLIVINLRKMITPVEKLELGTLSWSRAIAKINTMTHNIKKIIENLSINITPPL